MTQAAVLIETPEGVRFSLPLAGTVSRFLAWLIDAAVIGIASGLVSQLLSIASLISPDVVVALTVLTYFVMSIGYGIGLEWFWHGQTLGKRTLRLRAFDANGLKLSFAQIAIRNLMRFIDSLPFLYLVGGTSAVLTRRHQRLGDLVANTIVIQKRQLVVPDWVKLNLEEKFNSLLDVPHLAARLRQQTSPELVELAYQALLRREELAPSVRLEVFRLLADRFRLLVKFPDEMTAGLTDERYVRNALQVVLGRV
jgi:uncharacterized RDD family membrane protein YckC